jgi:SAM-dependent methyltransferase
MNTTSEVNSIKLTKDSQHLLRCPSCKADLKFAEGHLECMSAQCTLRFPIVNGVPVIIDDASSVFSVHDFVDPEGSTLKPKSKLERTLVNLVPSIILNLKGKTNFEKLKNLLLKQNANPRVLIIGASVIGAGIETLLSEPSVDFVESDVAFGPRVSIIFDGHDIPFKEDSFDAVIIQAVLEHVVDPVRCVDEIHRILKKDGLIYAETPFMQQVHLGRYDFTRYTHLGHRRLFRKFEEVESGAVCGPGMALAWSYQYFLLSFVKSSKARLLVKFFARLTSFWLTFFDYYLIDKAGTFDSASGYYFMGKKSSHVLSDRTLLSLYKGTQMSSF